MKRSVGRVMPSEKILQLSKASKKQDRQLDHQLVSDLFAGITMRFSTGMVAARTFIIMDDDIIQATFFPSLTVSHDVFYILKNIFFPFHVLIIRLITTTILPRGFIVDKWDDKERTMVYNLHLYCLPS